MHADAVAGDILVHNPKFLAGLLTLFFAAFYLLNPAGDFFTRLFPEEMGGWGRPAGALALAAGLALNLALIGFLPFRRQVAVVWVELAALFIGFFLVFDLSAEFIQSKLWFIISRGMTTTLYVSAVSISIAFAIAIVGAIAKLSGNGFAVAIASFYTSFFRGLPLLMQVYLIYLGLPQLGFVVDAIPAGIAALSLCYGAYLTEIFRAGIESISKGQWEGARALGFRFGMTMRLVILPQAAPVVVPPTGNYFIAMLKDSSLVSVIGVWEMMFLSRTLGTKTFQHMEMLITVAILYWLLTMALEAGQARIEAHYRQRGER